MLEIMIPAFVASVILIGIHSYLGMHIIARGVIFVDLSLAQIAACGAIAGVLLGIKIHTTLSYFISLLFTFFGAIIFSFSRSKRHKEIPQEAVIGIVYVITASLSILILDRLPSESEHLKEMLVGNILFVNNTQLLKTAILYSIIGIIHYIFREKFFMISFEPERAEKEINIRLWDFIFYALFGLVVTSSVELAGVFLVFTFLIIPQVAAIMLFKTITKRLLFAWIWGTAIALLGLYFSASFDTPTGPTIIVTYGLSLIMIWIVSKMIKN